MMSRFLYITILTLVFFVWIGQATSASENLSEYGNINRHGENYLLQIGNLELEIDPLHGARIIAFRIDGKNILSESLIDSRNYGSTFWPSPQTLWGWPPIPELDSYPYEITASDSELILSSEVSQNLCLQITKRISVITSAPGITIEYTITNFSQESQHLAPWEISRVHANGLTFFPSGLLRFSSSLFETLHAQDLDGITWFQYDGSLVQTDQKLYSDGSEGWLAHVEGDMLLVKSFEDISIHHQAPSEGEIEIFASGSKPYIEIEQQGPYSELVNNESLSWSVNWFLQRVPDNITVERGNKQLVELVRRIVSFQT